MSAPASTVYVYAEVTGEAGQQYWLKYVAIGSDHEEAANLAIRAWSGCRIRRVETFDGEPQQWFAGAARYYDVGAKKEDPTQAYPCTKKERRPTTGDAPP